MQHTEERPLWHDMLFDKNGVLEKAWLSDQRRLADSEAPCNSLAPPPRKQDRGAGDKRDEHAGLRDRDKLGTRPTGLAAEPR